MWLWILLGLLGGIIAVCLIIMIVGNRLPDTYRASGSVVVSVSPEALWEQLANFEERPRAVKMARSVERLADSEGKPVWKEDLGQSVVTWKAVEWNPPHRMVCEAQDSVVPMTARWVTEIHPHEGGARVVLNNETRIAEGTWHVPVFRVLMTLTHGARRGMTDYLRSIEPSFDPQAVVWE